MDSSFFTSADRHVLAERGIALAEAERQVRRLGQAPRYVELVRPCTVGDGIERIARANAGALHRLHAESARPGRFVKFVPASGAASRMFADLHDFHSRAERALPWVEILAQAAAGAARERSLVQFLSEIEAFAFHDDLERVLRREGLSLADLALRREYGLILAALLDPRGLDYDAQPKGLLPFHRYPDGPRTAFVEHLIEAADFVRDSEGLCRLHLTVAPECRALFEQHFLEVEPALGRRLEARFEVGFSFQKPSTDTLAVDEAGAVLRDARGALRFRPGGHGALIENLNDLRADLVFIKNIDNVQPDRVKPVTSHWKRALAGRLVGLQRSVFGHLDRLREPDPAAAVIEAAAEFVQEELNLRPGPNDPPATSQCRRAFLIDRLHRPLRVAGVVPATGEPGGGPFWVREPDGSIALRIVEGAEIDPGSAEQQRIRRASTHFNPVDLVCGLRDAHGKQHDLHAFIDRDADIVTTKTEAGRTIRVLERPGLWNGAMAGWITSFVEVPLETFSPVKTVLDLLREEHRA